jgi:hypothetical protein
MGRLLALRCWRRHPELRPSGARLWAQYILLPLIPNLSLAAVPVVLKAKGLLQYLKLYNPDIFWTAIICGGLSAGRRKPCTLSWRLTSRRFTVFANGSPI